MPALVRAGWARVALGMVLVAACAVGPKLAGGVRTDPLQVAEVSLPDASSADAPMNMKAAPGELLLVYFGYTSCPDVCPLTMSDVSRAIKALPADMAPKVDMAMVTLDPERDTGERLTAYLDHFFERRHALRTTDPQQLKDAADAFGVRWEVEEHEPGDEYKLSHTAVTYVVDEDGTVLVEWPFGMKSELMKSDLEILLARQG